MSGILQQHHIYLKLNLFVYLRDTYIVYFFKKTTKSTINKKTTKEIVWNYVICWFLIIEIFSS